MFQERRIFPKLDTDCRLLSDCLCLILKVTMRMGWMRSNEGIIMWSLFYIFDILLSQKKVNLVEWRGAESVLLES